jgi:hypothetical protein
MKKQFSYRLAALLTCTALASGVLIGCGGGSAAGVVAPTKLAGAVVDGYIEGAKVCLDVNNNQTCDVGEPSDTSKVDGSYKLDTSALTATQIAKAHILVDVPTTAKDADDGGQTLAAAGKAAFTLMAPASKPEVISPLTTLVSHELIKDAGLSLAQAQTAVRNKSSGKLKDTDDLMQDIGKIKRTDANVNVKNVAESLAITLGEIRKAIDTGSAAAGTSGATTTEQQKILATLNNVQAQLATLTANINTNSTTQTKPADIQAALKTATDTLKTSTGATAAISGTVQTTAPATNLLAGASLYDGSSCASSTASPVSATIGAATCTPYFYKTDITAAGKVTSSKYNLVNNAWVNADSNNEVTLNTTTNAWVSRAGTTGDLVVDTSGTAGTFTDSVTGQKTRVTMRQADISNKDISKLTSIGTVPSSLAGLIFPANSIQYLGQFTPLNDRYFLWNGGTDAPYLTNVSYDPVTKTNVTTKFRSLAEWMTAYATPANGVINGTCWYGLNVPVSACFTFDAGGSAAGGNLSIGIYGTNGLVTQAEKGSYEIRTFGSIKVLVITKVPSSLASMYNGSNGLSIYSEKDGFAVGGNLTLAGVTQGSQNPSFNKTAFAAIVGKLNTPALP